MGCVGINVTSSAPFHSLSKFFFPFKVKPIDKQNSTIFWPVLTFATQLSLLYTATRETPPGCTHAAYVVHSSHSCLLFLALSCVTRLMAASAASAAASNVSPDGASTASLNASTSTSTTLPEGSQAAASLPEADPVHACLAGLRPYVSELFPDMYAVWAGEMLVPVGTTPSAHYVATHAARAAIARIMAQVTDSDTTSFWLTAAFCAHHHRHVVEAERAGMEALVRTREGSGATCRLERSRSVKRQGSLLFISLEVPTPVFSAVASLPKRKIGSCKRSSWIARSSLVIWHQWVYEQTIQFLQGTLEQKPCPHRGRP